MQALQPGSNRRLLQSLIRTADNLDEALYENDSAMESLTDALLIARFVDMAGDGSTQAIVDTAALNLQASLLGLNLKPDLARLEQTANQPPTPDEGDPAAAMDKLVLDILIGLGDAVSQSQQNAMIPWAQTVFADALAMAKAVSADTEATQAAVNLAEQYLLEALGMPALYLKANTSALSALVARAAAIRSSLDSYKETGKSAFLSALDQAEAVLANGNAQQAAVDAAGGDLETAMEALEERADKAKLEAAIRMAAELNRSWYFDDDAMTALNAALAAAQSVYAEPDIDQAEVDAAYTGLFNVLLNLNMKVSKEILGSIVSRALNLNLNRYMSEGVTVLNKAVANAQRLLADDSPESDHPDAVFAAYAAVQKAMDGLVLLGETDSPKTGVDTTRLSLAITAGLLSLVWLLKKRKSVKQ